MSKWRKRFVAEGIAGLADRKRLGRPRVFAAAVAAQAMAIACQLPAAPRGAAWVLEPF